MFTQENLDAMDADFEKEYGLEDLDTSNDEVEDIEEEIIVEEESTEETGEDSADTTDENEVEEEVAEETEENVDKKPTKEEKAGYAFEQLRNSNKELQEKLDKAAAYEKSMLDIANYYGYATVEQYNEAFNKAKSQKEAQAGGYTPEQYEQLTKLQQKVAALEESNKQIESKAQFDRFETSIAKVFSAEAIDMSQKETLFNNLGEMGYDLETILKLPNPEPLIRGAMIEIIANNKVQAQVKKDEKSKKIADKSYTSTTVETFNLDKAIADEMKEYKLSRGY